MKNSCMSLSGRDGRMNNSLTCQRVSINYTDKEILKNVNFTIRSHKIAAMIGASGGGKSTILKAIAGFIPYQGEIRLNQEILTSSDWRRGVVFQDSSLFPWLTVYENISFGLRAKKYDQEKIKKRCMELLNLIGMQQYRDNLISTLSGGMKQRVAIARALANKPLFLLMDEPFGALDSVTRNKMQNLIINVAREENIGILLITHDITEALKCGNNVLVLNKERKNFENVGNPFFNQSLAEIVNNNSFSSYQQLEQELVSYL